MVMSHRAVAVAAPSPRDDASPRDDTSCGAAAAVPVPAPPPEFLCVPVPGAVLTAACDDSLHACAAGCHDHPAAECELWRALRMGALLLLLFAGYCVTRLITRLGLPSDGRRSWRAGDVAGARTLASRIACIACIAACIGAPACTPTAELCRRSGAADVGPLLAGGVVLGWLVRVDEAARWRFLASRRNGPALLLLFFGVSPVYSALNQVPGLQISLADLSVWKAPAWTAVSCGAAVVASLLAWHVRHAWRTLPRQDCLAYLACRALIFAFLGAAVGGAERAFEQGRELRSPHLHHLYLAWALAACGAFNHRASAALLALAAGVYAQGVGAYGFDPLLADGGCKNFTMPAVLARSVALSASCRWDDTLIANGLVRLRVCPADAAALAQSQYMRCGARRGPVA